MNGQPRANFSLIEHAPLELTQRPARDKTILQELWGIPEDRIVLLSVCRPTAGNGWEALLNAVRRLPRELRAKTAVLLVGIGPADFRYVQRLRHYLARIENGVLVIDPENLDLYYRAADIFVAHEAEDLRPTAVLKALAAGLPILGSEYLERSELLHRNVTGIVIPPHDDRSLARSLAALLTDGALRTEMGIHAFDWLASRSHPDVIVENWEKLLLEAAELSDSFGRPARSLVSSSEIEVPAGDRLAAAGAT
jgi:glycosyltransferase involved in cell wall biosynthesis